MTKKSRTARVAILIVLFLENTCHVLSLTDAQVASTLKLVRNVCQPKTKVTDQEIEEFHKSINLDNPSKNLMCYHLCVLKQTKAIKNDKIDVATVGGAIPTLPKHLHDYSERGLAKCPLEAISADRCEYAHQYCKCLLILDPTKYFLP